jgi:ankyrin repeat protein
MRNASESCTGSSALSVAAGGNKIEVIQLLVDAGADVNPASSDGYTALRLAQESGQLGIVKLLQEAGA